MSAALRTFHGGRYELLEELGRGGMGHVFEAIDTVTGTRIALKVMAPNAAEGDDKRIARFEREARMASGLDTEHVARVLDAGVDRESNRAFIAMEKLSGLDLGDLLRRVGPLRPQLASRIIAQACLGLAKAHERGIVHRDIKPGNLFLANLDDRWIVKVLDFGIAKIGAEGALLKAEGPTLTETGMLIGSPHYMSPEQARGWKTLDHRADLWSLGVVLYKCLTGRTAFDSHETFGELLIAICSERPTPIQSLAPWVSTELAQVVRRAMTREVEKRFQSAVEMAESLKPLTGGTLEILPSDLGALSDEERALCSPVAPPSSRKPTLEISSTRRLPAGELPDAEASEPSDDRRGVRERVSPDSRVLAVHVPRARRQGIALAAVATVALTSGAGLMVFRERAMSRPAVTARANQAADLERKVEPVPARASAPNPPPHETEPSVPGRATGNEPHPTKLPSRVTTAPPSAVGSAGDLANAKPERAAPPKPTRPVTPDYDRDFE